MKTVCVIPARYGSQRLPKKPLTLVKGRPLIQWVVEAARRFSVVDEILVATDHEEIVRAVEAIGASAILTDPDCPSGTDRIHQAMQGRPGDIIINLQGDEPGMPPDTVAQAHAALLAHGADVSTACVPIRNIEDFESPHVVKVVRDTKGRALYFSRSPIPSLSRRDPEVFSSPGYVFGFKHLGLYIFRRRALEEFCGLSPSSLELIEKLEQLRMLENGMTIHCVTSSADSIGVDVEADVRKLERLLSQGDT